MKFDEIGDQIIDSDLTEALHAFTFQVIRRWQILDRQKFKYTRAFLGWNKK